MLNLSLKNVVIYCDGIFFISQFLFLEPLPLEILISSDISVCTSVCVCVCADWHYMLFRTYISVNKRL